MTVQSGCWQFKPGRPVRNSVISWYLRSYGEVKGETWLLLRSGMGELKDRRSISYFTTSSPFVLHHKLHSCAYTHVPDAFSCCLPGCRRASTYFVWGSAVVFWDVISGRPPHSLYSEVCKLKVLLTEAKRRSLSLTRVEIFGFGCVFNEEWSTVPLGCCIESYKVFWTCFWDQNINLLCLWRRSKDFR